MRRLSFALPLSFAVLAVLSISPASRSIAGPDDPPKIRSVAPLSALRGGTVDIAIEGQNLLPYDDIQCNRPEISMVIQPVPTAYKIVLRLTIPDAASAGPVEFSIKTRNGIAKTDKFVVKLRTPTIAKATPSSLVRGSEVDVRLDGTNLAFTGQDTTLTVEPPMTAKQVGKATDKQMTVHVVVPAATPVGPRPLTLETTDGKFTTNLTVVLAPPAIDKVTPPAVARGTEADLVVAGKNLLGSEPVALAIPDASVAITPKGAPTVNSIGLHVVARADAAPGPRVLVVHTPDGTASAKFEVYTPPPRLVAMKPAGVARGDEAVVVPTVEGAGGAFGLHVLPDDPTLTITKDPSGTWKAKACPDAMPGPRTIVLDHPFGTSATTFMVNVRSPSVAGLAPGDLAPGKESDVVVEGQSIAGAVVTLAVEDPSVVVTPGPAAGVVHVAVAADAKPGPRPVVVRTPDGVAITALIVAGATPSAPAITAAGVPGRIARGRATEVAFTGVNLRSAGDKPPTVAASSVEGPVPATIVASTSTSLRVKLEPPATLAAGGIVVTVVTSDGAAAGSTNVVAATPALAIATPARLTRPGNAQVVLGGTDLVGPDGAAPTVALVRPDGTLPIEAHVDSAAPEKVVVTIPLVDATPTGPWVLTLRTKDGGAAIPLPVEAAVPSIDSIDPGMLGSPAMVTFTVKGRNLAGPAGKKPAVSITQLGAASPLLVDVVDAKPDVLAVRISTKAGAHAGPHVLVVKTADGSAAAIFEVVDAPMPSIDSLAPATGDRMATTTVMLKGKGLLGTTAVTLSGAGVTAAIQPGGSDTVIPLRITVAKDAEPGVRTVTVTAPGGQTSNEKITFTVK